MVKGRSDKMLGIGVLGRPFTLTCQSSSLVYKVYF